MFDLKRLQQLIYLTVVFSLWGSMVVTAAILVALLWLFRVPWSITAAVAGVSLLAGVAVGWLVVALGPKKPGQQTTGTPGARAA